MAFRPAWVGCGGSGCSSSSLLRGCIGTTGKRGSRNGILRGNGRWMRLHRAGSALSERPMSRTRGGRQRGKRGREGGSSERTEIQDRPHRTDSHVVARQILVARRCIPRSVTVRYRPRQVSLLFHLYRAFCCCKATVPGRARFAQRWRSGECEKARTYSPYLATTSQTDAACMQPRKTAISAPQKENFLARRKRAS